MDDKLLDDELAAESKLKIAYNPIFICFVLYVIAVMFRIMHWPGGALMSILSSMGILSYVAFVFINTKFASKNFNTTGIFLSVYFVYVTFNNLFMTWYYHLQWQFILLAISGPMLYLLYTIIQKYIYKLIRKDFHFSE